MCLCLRVQAPSNGRAGSNLGSHSILTKEQYISREVRRRRERTERLVQQNAGRGMCGGI